MLDRLLCAALRGDGLRILCAGAAVLLEPSDGTGNIRVENPVIAMTECEPGHVCQVSVRHNDGPPQPNTPHTFVQPDLGEGDVGAEDLRFKQVIQDAADARVSNDGEDLRLTRPQNFLGRVTTNPRNHQLAYRLDPKRLIHCVAPRSWRSCYQFSLRSFGRESGLREPQ